MTMAWILYVLLVGTLLFLAALAVDEILQRTALPSRWIWLAALGGIVALAILAPRRASDAPAFRTSPTPAVATNELVVPAPSADVMRAIEQVRAMIVTSVTSAFVAAEVRVPRLLVPALGVIWGLLSAAVFGVLVIVSRRLNVARRTWPLRDVAGTPVRVAPATGPAVIGISRPEIVVPTWLLERPAPEQRLVIVHEREHVTARDQLLLAGGWLVATLLPWHPAVWWALSRLRLAIELDCDARVLDRGVQPRSYGTLLIDIAGQCAGHRIGALALADRPSHLERRLLAMKHTRTRFIIARTGALAAMALLAVAVACEARLPTSSEMDAMNVAAVEKTAVQAKLLEESRASSRTYTVDGVVVSAADARAILANRVARVDIVKGKSGDEIHVVTTDLSKKAAERMKETSWVAFRTDGSGGDTVRGVTPLRLKSSKKGFDGVVIIDGVTASEHELALLSAKDIASIDVIKGASAQTMSPDPAAVNGVIKVTTKRGARK